MPLYKFTAANKIFYLLVFKIFFKNTNVLSIFLACELAVGLSVGHEKSFSVVYRTIICYHDGIVMLDLLNDHFKLTNRSLPAIFVRHYFQ